MLLGGGIANSTQEKPPKPAYQLPRRRVLRIRAQTRPGARTRARALCFFFLKVFLFLFSFPLGKKEARRRERERERERGFLFSHSQKQLVEKKHSVCFGSRAQQLRKREPVVAVAVVCVEPRCAYSVSFPVSDLDDRECSGVSLTVRIVCALDRPRPKPSQPLSKFNEILHGARRPPTSPRCSRDCGVFVKKENRAQLISRGYIRIARVANNNDDGDGDNNNNNNNNNRRKWTRWVSLEAHGEKGVFYFSVCTWANHRPTARSMCALCSRCSAWALRLPS